MNKKTIFIIIAVIIVLFFAIKIIKKQDIPIDYPVVEEDYEKISVVGETSKYGMYDPSVEYDENGVGWMVYSSFFGLEDKLGYLDTHLAKSTDYGKTWEFVKNINPTKEDNLIINEKIIEEKVNAESVSGVWRHETPTLVFDPNDPDENRRWKLFWIKAFSRQPYKNELLDNNIFYGHGLVMYKHAKTPEDLSNSKEIALFNSRDYSPKANFNLNDIHPSDIDYFLFMEPGVFVKDGNLYLAMHGGPLPPYEAELFLLSSNDYGVSWNFVDTIVSNKDADDLGYDELTAPSIVKEGTRIFLQTSPVKKIKFPKQRLQYTGIYIFEFDDIEKGKLKRNSDRKLIVHKYIPPLGTRSVGGGQSDYHEKNTYGGIIMAQSFPKEPTERFQIFSTKEKIID